MLSGSRDQLCFALFFLSESTHKDAVPSLYHPSQTDSVLEL
ncbi:hypothetical protein Trydic_g4842 [Trypoxylus dichotomus]